MQTIYAWPELAFFFSFFKPLFLGLSIGLYFWLRTSMLGSTKGRCCSLKEGGQQPSVVTRPAEAVASLTRVLSYSTRVRQTGQAQ